jgi:hypothetical protein
MLKENGPVSTGPFLFDLPLFALLLPFFLLYNKV